MFIMFMELAIPLESDYDSMIWNLDPPRLF